MDALPGPDSPSLLNPEKAGLPWNSSFLISPTPSFFFSSLDFSLREGGRGVDLEGWEFAKGVKGALLGRFTGEVDLYLYLLSELPYTQGKVDGNNWKLSDFFPLRERRGLLTLLTVSLVHGDPP